MPPRSNPRPLSPLQATQALLDVSVTERIQFRECRRRWHLDVIQNLGPRGPSELALEFGTAIHHALDALYAEGEDHMMPAWNEYMDHVQKLTDGGESWEDLLGHRELGEIMLENYLEYCEQTRVPLGRILAVEGQILDKSLRSNPPEGYPPTAAVVIHESGRLMVPIVDPTTKDPLTPGWGFHLGVPPTGTARRGVPHMTARLDLIAERSTPRKGLWVIDHKTAASAPSDRGLDFDDQTTAYCYALWRWLGIVPRGAVFNYLIKDAPSEPRIVKAKGKGGSTLSYAKDQNTLPNLYREALKEHGLMRGSTITSEKHAGCLAALLARGWDNFFRRFEPTRNLDELLSFEHRLYFEYQDMQEVMHYTGGRAYPNPSIRRCPYCPVSRICQAMEDGSDVQGVIDSSFQQKPDRKVKRLA